MPPKTPDKISRRKLKELLERKEEQFASGKKSKIITRLSAHERSILEHKPINKYKEITVEDLMDLKGMLGGGGALRSAAPLENMFVSVEEERKSELGLVATLDEIFSSGIGLPPDLKIDDRDLKVLPNVFEWAMSSKGAKMKPYARQYEVMIKSCSEWCPRCTAKRWPRKKPGFAKSFHYSPALPVDFDVANIHDYVQHLENGRCPSCKARKSELVRSGDLPLVVELDMCLGQRCLIDDTLLQTNYGLMRIEDLVGKETKPGFSEYLGDVKVFDKDGTLHDISKVFVSKPETLLTFRTGFGARITGTKDHPLWDGDDFVTMKEFNVGDAIPVYLNSSPFGIKENLDWVYPAFVKERDAYIESKSHQVKQVWKAKGYMECEPAKTIKLDADMARMLGYYTSEGTGNAVRISNHDPDVLDTCERALVRLYGKDFVTRSPTEVSARNKLAVMHFNLLLRGIPRRSTVQRVPKVILESSKSIQREYLRAMFEGDGGMDRDTLSYYTTSPELSDQMQCLLLSFGIISKRVAEENDQYIQHIKVTGPEMLSRFQSKIGFLSVRKQELLEATIQKLSSRTKSNPFFYEILPVSVKAEFLDLIAEFKVELGQVVRAKLGIPVTQACSIYQVFDANHGMWRIGKGDVNLTRRRIVEFQEGINSHPYLSSVRLRLRKRLNDFVARYTDENVYWTTVEDIRNEAKQKTYDITVPGIHRFMLGNGVLSSNSGKSATIYSLIPYLIHKWLKVPSPVQALSLLDNTLLSGVVVALTYAKAVSLLWQPIHSALSNTGWFKEYHALLNDRQEFYGEEFFKFKDSFVQYGHRNMIFSPSGPNKRTLRGETRCWSATDEIGFFYHGDDGDDKERASANEVYVSLGNSLFTVKKAAEKALLKGMDAIPMTLMANISSPSSYKDKIMSLIREFENEPTVVTMHLPTWEFNPNATKSDFKKEYAADPVKADRDFGANPPMSENPYLPDLQPMKHQVMKGLRNMIEYEYAIKKATNGAPQRYAKIKRLRPFVGTIPKHILTIDAGVSNNSFAMTVGYPQMYRDKLRVVTTGVVEIAPHKGQNTLNFTQITKQMIYPIIEHFNVGLVVTDRWNSLKLLHDIEDEYGIHTQQYSLRPDDFNFIYDYLMDEDFAYSRIPMPEIDADKVMEVDIDEYPQCFGPGNKTTKKPMPVSHLIHQSQTVQVNSRGAVDKGLGLTDDIFRSYCLLTFIGVDEEAVEEYGLLHGAVQGEKRAIGAMARGGMSPGGKSSGSGKAMSSSVGAVGGSGSAGAGGSRVVARSSG